MQNRTKARIAEAKIAAAKLVNEFVVREPKDIRVREIAVSKGALVLEEGLRGAVARLTRGGGNKFGIIRIRADISELGRRRFALGHELGHWLLHANLSQIEFCTRKDIEGYVNSDPELAASAFAASLLMPGKLFRPRCWNFDPDLDLIKDLASDFSTTLTATAARFVEECKADCVAVFSENGIIRRWVKREHNAPPVWFRSQQPLSEAALAWTCMSDGQGPAKMTAVPPDAWFPEIPRVREVYEHSMKLGNYPTVLSLLWIRGIESASVDPEVEEPLEELDPEEFSLRRRRWR